MQLLVAGGEAYSNTQMCHRGCGIFLRPFALKIKILVQTFACLCCPMNVMKLYEKMFV